MSQPQISRFRDTLGVNIAKWINVRTQGAVKATFLEAATSDDDDPRADEYRRLSASKRDLKPLEFRKAQDMSFYLWQRNPIARRMIAILVEFCTGDEFKIEVKIQSKDAQKKWSDVEGRLDAQEVWDEFSEDPINRFIQDLPLFIQDFLINGELPLMMFPNLTVNPAEPGTVSGDGHVRMGYCDPSNITQVIPELFDVRQIKIIMVRGQGDANETPLTAVRPNIDRSSDRYGMLEGQVLFFRLNHVVNQTRGHGHLLDTADWLDALDQFLFDALEGIRLRNSFFYDATIDDADEEKIKEIAKELTVPASGALRVHNQKVKYDVVTPDLKAQDIERAMLAYQTFIVGAKGYPVMWFGSGADTNKATAGEMAIPTMKMIRSMQSEIRKVIEQVVKYVTDQARIAGVLKLADNEKIDVRVSMFDPEKKGTEDMAMGFNQMVVGLAAAVREGWISPETAKRVIDGMLTRIGVAVDPNETVQDLQDELAAAQADKAANDMYNTPPQPGNTDPNAPPDEQNPDGKQPGKRGAKGNPFTASYMRRLSRDAHRMIDEARK